MLILILGFLFQMQQPQTCAIVQWDKVEIVSVSAAKAEYQKLAKKKNLNDQEHVRFAALVITVGTLTELQR